MYMSNQEAANEDVLKVIKDLRDAQYFKVATGIYAEKSLRESLIYLHEKTSHSITWTNIKRSLPYLSATSDTKIEVRKQKCTEKIGYWYNIGVGSLFFCFAIVIFLAFFLVSPGSVGIIVGGATLSLLCAFFAFFVFSQNWPVTSAKKIKEELHKVGQGNPNPNSEVEVEASEVEDVSTVNV